MTAMAAVLSHFGCFPLKKLQALWSQWPWCPTHTSSGLHYPYLFTIFSCASLLSLQYLYTGVCGLHSYLLLVKRCRNSKWSVLFPPWCEPLETMFDRSFTQIYHHPRLEKRWQTEQLRQRKFDKLVR